MSDWPPELRAEILRLLRGGMDAAEIETLAGASRGRINAMKSHLGRGTYNSVENVETLNEIETSTETTFGLERDLESALRRNIGDLEGGLSIIDDGKQRRVGSGFIDITARDRNGATVVIELKAGTADRDAIGQILAYMGDVLRPRNQFAAF
jgi:hypothetical protein